MSALFMQTFFGMLVVFIVFETLLRRHDTHTIRGTTYRVMRTHKNTKSDALLRLMYLKKTAISIAAQLEEPHSERLSKRLRNTIFEELSPPYTPYIASTVNKGDKINICVRNMTTGSLYSKEHMVYVLMHELAHILTDNMGHGQDFEENMNLLVRTSQSIGVIRLALPSVPYCGQMVGSF
jgi:predicted metal-dependent hydrolase